jgi:hypothetical protein
MPYILENVRLTMTRGFESARGSADFTPFPPAYSM